MSVSSMFNKFFNVPKLTCFSGRVPPKVLFQPPLEPREEPSSSVKIVHAGGVVECYFTAIPAFKIMEKHPSLVLARPQVFRQPWESVIRSHEILIPGEKLYLVPRRTVRKLLRRIKKPDRQASLSSSFLSKSSINVSSSLVFGNRDDSSTKEFTQQRHVGDSSEASSSFSANSNRKKSAIKKQVRFTGIDDPSESDTEKKGKRRAWAWQPSLTAISEKRGDR